MPEPQPILAAPPVESPAPEPPAVAPLPTPEPQPILAAPPVEPPAPEAPATAAPTPEPQPIAESSAEPQPIEVTATVAEVIFVEDDAALAELLAYGLQSRAYRFLSYRNGREALRELLALDVQGTRPLLLLDVDLPGLDGYSVFDALQRERPAIYRVVFTTVHGTEEEQLRGLEAGALDYMVKPISLRVALEKIKRWVGR
jgi:CheY-like chemotaxis protein